MWPNFVDLSAGVGSRGGSVYIIIRVFKCAFMIEIGRPEMALCR